MTTSHRGELQDCLDVAAGRWSLWGLVERRAEQSSGEAFVIHGDRTLTFADVADRALRTADALAAMGVGRGDKVAVMLPNCLEYLDVWFATARLGAVMVPINTALRGEGLRYILEHSESALAVVEPDHERTLAEAMAGAEGPRIVWRGDGPDDLAALVAGGHPPGHRADVAPEELASILYTSGTTGLPKGVMNCHNAYAVAGHEFAASTLRIRTDDVLYTTLPLFHINAQALTTMGSLVSGRPMVLAPRFSASGFFDEMRRHGATIFNYIGAMLTMVHKQPERPDDADNPARLAVGGAAPKELWPAFERRFGVRIHELYGLTETACVCLSNPSDDVRVGKIGKPVSWSEVRVEDASGGVAGVDEPGEICVRAKQPAVLMLGYFKNQAATDEALRGGWFHTGDRGSRDADGYFTFIDRMKDSIRRRGENVSSYEVERAVNAMDGIAESAAVGVPSELGEEDIMVVVVLKDGHELRPSDVVQFCEQRIAKFMVPRYVRFIDELPKTGTERVRKFVLREQGVDGAWDREAAPRPSGD